MTKYVYELESVTFNVCKKQVENTLNSHLRCLCQLTDDVRFKSDFYIQWITERKVCFKITKSEQELRVCEIIFGTPSIWIDRCLDDKSK